MMRMIVGLMTTVLIFASGCRNTQVRHADAAALQAMLDGAAVAMTPYKTEHAGNTAAQAIGGGALGGALGYVVVAVIDQSGAGVPELEKEAVNAITAELQQSFNLLAPATDEQLSKALLKDNPKKQALSQFADMAGSEYVMKVWFRFTHRDKLANSVAIYAQWLVYDKKGEKRLEITTFVYSPQKSALLPNTRNPVYHDQYVDLARRSAQKFLRLMRGEPEPVAAK